MANEDAVEEELEVAFRPTAEAIRFLRREVRSKLRPRGLWPLFKQLARNSPGSGRLVEDPSAKRNGWIQIVDNGRDARPRIGFEQGNTVVDNDDLGDHAEAPRARLTASMCQTLISKVHRVARDHDVYLGRTHFKEDAPHSGIANRWRDHYNELGAEYGQAFFRLPVDQVEDAETLGIALLKFWNLCEKPNGDPVLCCNNTAFGSPGPLTRDEWQVIYVVLSPK